MQHELHSLPRLQCFYMWKGVENFLLLQCWPYTSDLFKVTQWIVCKTGMTVSAGHLIKAQPKYVWKFAGGLREHLGVPTLPKRSILIDYRRGDVFFIHLVGISCPQNSELNSFFSFKFPAFSLLQYKCKLKFFLVWKGHFSDTCLTSLTRFGILTWSLDLFS